MQVQKDHPPMLTGPGAEPALGSWVGFENSSTAEIHYLLSLREFQKSGILTN